MARSAKTSPRPAATKPKRSAAEAAHRAEMDKLVLLDGLSVRRRRHDRGWSPRDLVRAISDASFVASGLRRTLTPNQIQAIEERDERVPYGSLLLLADGLDCDPVDLMGTDPRRELRKNREKE